MRLLFAGTPAAAVPSLNALEQSEHEIVAVLSRPDRPAGRGRGLHRSEVASRADALGLPVLQPRTVRDPSFVNQLTELDIDVAAIVAYGGLIPPDLLDIPRLGWINLHYSLLPRWRGAAPVQHAIAAGDDRTGVSIFQLEAGLDTGPVFATEEVEIGPQATSGSLLDDLSERGARLLARTISDLGTGRAVAAAQPDSGITLAPKIETADVQLDFARTSAEVDRLVRSATPTPGAWVLIGSDRVKIGPLEVTDEQLPAGELAVRKREVLIGTADRAVRLGQIQPPGKKPMAAADAARGARWVTGDRVGAR